MCRFRRNNNGKQVFRSLGKDSKGGSPVIDKVKEKLIIFARNCFCTGNYNWCSSVLLSCKWSNKRCEIMQARELFPFHKTRKENFDNLCESSRVAKKIKCLILTTKQKFKFKELLNFASSNSDPNLEKNPPISPKPCQPTYHVTFWLLLLLFVLNPALKQYLRN